MAANISIVHFIVVLPDFASLTLTVRLKDTLIFLLNVLLTSSEE